MNKSLYLLPYLKLVMFSTIFERHYFEILRKLRDFEEIYSKTIPTVAL